MDKFSQWSYQPTVVIKTHDRSYVKPLQIGSQIRNLYYPQKKIMISGEIMPAEIINQNY